MAQSSISRHFHAGGKASSLVGDEKRHNPPINGGWFKHLFGPDT
jgi:hypothetical protein